MAAGAAPVVKLRPLGEATALVTGASSGIGTATVERLVASGCRVIATARRQDRLASLAARLGPKCLPLALDVADTASVDSLIDRLPGAWCDIDILVNNAGHGVGGKTPFAEGALAHWLSMIETNVSGMMRVTHVLAPSMLARGGGQIVNIGSILGVLAPANDAAYAATKFAVNGFSRSLRLEYLGKVRVIEILPGIVRTEFDEVRHHGDKAHAEAFYGGFPTCLEPEDVAACIVFAVGLPARATVAELLVLPSG